MTLKIDFAPYMTEDDYVNPFPVPAGTVRACDNETMFTSEYYIMLNRNNEIAGLDQSRYCDLLIHNCIGEDLHLHRARFDNSPDVIDNHLGVLAGFAEFGQKVEFKLPLALCRFPQLIYAYLLNKGVPSILMFPLAFITALIIATSCIGAPKTDTDGRRLAWLLIQAVKRKSLICRLASKIWFLRLYKDYPEGMNEVASMYYQPLGYTNPFAKYWIA